MERKLPMTLNDQLYSRLVNLYQGLDEQHIHQLNARLILLLSEEISDSIVIKKIIDQICDKYGFSYYIPSHNPGEMIIQYEKL